MNDRFKFRFYDKQCKMYLPDGYYINGNKWMDDYYEDVYDLPENIRVIEICVESIDKPSVLRFNVINTTGMMYESSWRKLIGPSDIIQCETTRNVISSHKNCEMIFRYSPKNTKLIESIWEFSIPEHNLTIPVLFVGRISAV